MKRLFLFLLFCAPGVSKACPSCYGAPDSPQTAGMNAAILVMLGITGLVLTSIVGCFLVLWRRSRRRQAMLSKDLSINEYGNLEEKNNKGVMEWKNF